MIGVCNIRKVPLFSVHLPRLVGLSDEIYSSSLWLLDLQNHSEYHLHDGGLHKKDLHVRGVIMHSICISGLVVHGCRL